MFRLRLGAVTISSTAAMTAEAPPKLVPMVGRSQSFVSNYERAQRRLDLPDLILVCRALGVEPVELLRRLD